MKEVEKIVVGVDFSKNAEKILQSAVYVAEKFQAELAIIHVVERFDSYVGLSIPHMSFDELEKDMQESAKKKMEDFVMDNLGENASNKTTVLAGKAATEIVGYAGSEGVDLIIVGTHGYRGLEKVLLGSVAERVVGTAPCPVLTINPYK